MVLDAIQLELVAGTAIIVGAPLLTWGLGKIPQTRTWIRNESIKAYAWMDKNKGNVPVAGLEAWQAAYNELDAIVQAFADDEVTPAELRHMATHAFEMVLAVKKLVA